MWRSIEPNTTEYRSRFHALIIFAGGWLTAFGVWALIAYPLFPSPDASGASLADQTGSVPAAALLLAIGLPFLGGCWGMRYDAAQDEITLWTGLFGVPLLKKRRHATEFSMVLVERLASSERDSQIQFPVRLVGPELRPRIDVFFNVRKARQLALRLADLLNLGMRDHTVREDDARRFRRRPR